MFPEEAAPSAPMPQLALRPLSTGELLDRVFFLYRARPLLFWGIALVPALVGLVGGAAQLVSTRGVILPNGQQPRLMIFHSASTAALSLLTVLLSLAAYAMAQGAITRAVTGLSVDQPVAAKAALREAMPHTLRYIGIELWKVWSAIWVPALLGSAGAVMIATRVRVFGALVLALAGLSFIYGVIAYIRNSLAIAASVVEGLPVRLSMRRSKVLTTERKWRIFLLFVLLAVLYLVAGLIALPLTLLLVHVHGPVHLLAVAAINQLVGFGLTLLLTPIAAIGLTLFYLDERVRREGLDIDLLLRGAQALQPGEAAAPGALAPERLG